MNSSEMAIKRSILLSARIRFAPETQPIKETAIEKIIEQNLFVLDSTERLTLQEIIETGGLCLSGELPAISQLDLDKAIQRLVEAGRLEPGEKEGKESYKLATQVRGELRETHKSVEKRLDTVINMLFRDVKGGSSIYKLPFFECLCLIFSRLGEAYVRLLKGDVELDELIKSPSAIRALKEISIKYPQIDASQFEAGLFTFFQESEPDYNTIKWNMTQNYFITKALGIDPSGLLLSKEFFGRATFYLDTNVIIHALEPTARHHMSFMALSEACKKLEIDLQVCQISLDELRSAVDLRKEVIVKVADQIPEETAPRVHGIFYQLYREQLESKGSVDLDELFSDFYHPSHTLAEQFNVGLIDNEWFIQAEPEPETETMVDAIREKYQSKRGRPKSRLTALHDALLIRWILKERDENAKNPLLVTLDTSLPEFKPAEEGKKTFPIAITLGAVLQWISPIAVQGDIEDDVADVFSETVKFQLLPQERFFTERDFLMFADMEWSCKELPAEDVERCIQYLRNNAPTLDPSKPEDREKLTLEITRFFSDPGRKFKDTVVKLESQLGEKDQTIVEKDKIINQLHAQVEKSKQEKEKTDAEALKSKLRAEAYVRLNWVIILFLVLELLAVYFAQKYGDGENFLQRLANLWFIPGFVAAVITPILGWIIVGKERLRVLDMPFLRFLMKE